MHGLHLKKRNSWYYYYRNRPKRYCDVEQSRFITFSLHTRSFSEAKVKASSISQRLENDWETALQRGISLAGENMAERYRAAVEVNRNGGLAPLDASGFSDDELLKRLRLLIAGDHSSVEQKAILGLIEKPSLDLHQAFNLFWGYIAEEYSSYSADQVRHKRNIYLRAIRGFEQVVGKIPLYEIKRRHALQFRDWLMRRKIKLGQKSYTGNRQLSSLRRLIGSIYERDGHDGRNPFERVRLKADVDVSRPPLTAEQIEKCFLAPDALKGLDSEFQLLALFLINTGMRPVEAIGLELNDVFIDSEVPFVHVRANKIRALKSPHSNRQIPLVGVSLDAAQKLVANGGWSEKRIGKNQYATARINFMIRKNGGFPEEGQSLYSLRHFFQDQLTKLAVVERVQCQLMGHAFARPKYGAGLNLAELRAIIMQFAL